MYTHTYYRQNRKYYYMTSRDRSSLAGRARTHDFLSSSVRFRRECVYVYIFLYAACTFTIQQTEIRYNDRRSKYIRLRVIIYTVTTTIVNFSKTTFFFFKFVRRPRFEPVNRTPFWRVSRIFHNVLENKRARQNNRWSIRNKMTIDYKISYTQP